MQANNFEWQPFDQFRRHANRLILRCRRGTMHDHVLIKETLELTRVLTKKINRIQESCDSKPDGHFDVLILID